MSEEICELKKQRAAIKSKITKLKNNIEQILEPQKVKVIEDKLQKFPELIANLEDVHVKLLSKLDEDDKEDAKTYRVDLISETEQFEEYIHGWLQHELENKDSETAYEQQKQEEKDEVAEQTHTNDDGDNTADEVKESMSAVNLEEAQKEHAKVLRQLQDIEEAKRLEEDIKTMRQKSQREALELENRKIQNVIAMRREKRKMMEEREKLKEELRKLVESEDNLTMATLEDISPTQTMHILMYIYRANCNLKK